MPDITIRKLTTAEDLLEVVAAETTYAFNASPQAINPDEMRWLTEPARPHHCFGLFEGDVPMATASYTPMRHNLRGHVIDVAGVWGVTTHPNGRRKGYAKRVIHASFEHMREQGHAITALYAFRESFYERLGYVTWPMPLTVTIKPEGLASLLKLDIPGEVERVSFKANAATIYTDYMKRVRARKHGLFFTEEWSADPERIHKERWTALARRDGEVVGLFNYEIKGDDGDDMFIHPFYYDDPEARFLLLRWLALHIDQVDSIKFWRLPPDEHPEIWVPDSYPKVESFEGALTRVLDVALLDEMPVTAADGRFTARIVDDYAAWNNGVYTFTGEGGVLRVYPADATAAECTLNINALSALLYGIRDPNEFNIRGWGDPSPEQQALMRAMFPAALPYADVTF